MKPRRVLLPVAIVLLTLGGAAGVGFLVREADRKDRTFRAERLAKHNLAIARARATERANQPVVPTVTPQDPAQRGRRLKELLASTRTKYDDVADVTWYKPASAPRLAFASGVYLYFGKTGKKDSGGNLTNLRLVVQYHGESWLFIEQYVFLIDDQRLGFNPAKVERDHYSDVWEWSDQPLDGPTTQIVQRLAVAKRAKVRFVGGTYTADRVVSQSQRAAIGRMVELYGLMGGTLDASGS